ncbi:MAG: nucleotidyltransferase domain-containing protein [Nanoarchaeota archaeon]
MEQNSYDSYEHEIILTLLRGENHGRGIAKMLNVNHMSVLRILKSLMIQNIVDYREEGKNKVYFLKNGIESNIAINMAEQYKLAQTLKKYPNLRNIIEEVQKNREVRLALLFGSYAKGLAKESSDIDIYIESLDQKLKKELEVIEPNASIKLGKYDQNNLLIKEIEKNHVIIKGVEEYYEKQKLSN